MQRKLLFAIVALMCSVGTWAQNPGDDMTSYITNPNFTGNADGWTITGQARYFNANGFDGTLSFIELTNWGSSWDATISQTVTLPNNGYYLVKAAGQMSGTTDCWMKLVANGAESNFCRNGNTDGNILANGTETTIGAGVAGWRYTSVIAKVTNGSLAISCVGHSDVKERWANFDAVSLTFLGTEIPANTDVTEFINNWDFLTCVNNNFPGWTIETSGGNTWVHGNTAVEFWNNNLDATFDYYQTINGLPEGRYVLSASMWSTQGVPNGNTGVYGTSNDVTVFAGVTDDCNDSQLHTYTTNGIFVNNGTLRVGVKNNGARSSNWFGVDWIKLQYMGKVVQDYAVALPDGGAMAADTWYYFDIAAAADNYNATATTLGDIICTDDGNTFTSAATGNVTLTATNNSFAAKRYYVKSSSANNLKIGVSSYSYSISEASADKAYIQPGQTVTVSYTVSTNDPGATLTQDYSGVTFNDAAISVTPTASGFTFTVPSVTENAEYTLAIPAGAIKYNEDSKNAAQNITLNTPAVFDGIYFLKVAATYDGSSEGTSAAVGKYLARGMNYGTHATLDKYGLPLQISTDANNATSIQAFDTKRYFFHGNTYDCYADQTPLVATGNFTITKSNGKLLIHNNTMAAGTYLKYNTSAAGDANIAVFDDGNGTNNGPIIMWTTESPAEHATVMQTLKDTQAANAAAAAYASGNYASLNGISTVAALEAELTANYIEGVFVAPSPIESISEKYQGGQPGAGNVTETVYSNTINITQPGFYKFSMQAFYRAGSNEVTQAMHTAGIDFPPVVLFFGNSETQIKSIYDEGGLDQGIADGYFETETVGGAPVQYNDKWYTNGQHNSVIIFQKDYYHNDVWFYASKPGEYSYGVKYMGWACANMQWFIYSPESVTITSYAAAADAADYTALTNAINTYDAAAWGFMSGEYAPYNNVTAIENITAAKAIDSEAQNSKLLVNSLASALTLSANASEVNAVYNGNFALSVNDGPMAGWVTDNAAGLGGTQHARAFVLTSGGNYDNLAAFGQGEGTRSCAYFRFDGTNSAKNTKYTYGSTAGYTMPLKTGTIYKLTAQAGGWGQTEKAFKMDVVNSSDASLVAQTLTTLATGVHAGGSVIDYEMYFIVPEDGNYKLVLSNASSDADNAVAVSNIVLKSTDALVFADGSVPTYAPGTYPSVKITRTLTANKWATAIYPFAVSGVDNIAVLDSYDKATGALGFTSADNSEANVPFLMRSTSDKAEITLSDVAVAAAAASDATVNEATLKGVYASTAIDNTAKNYVLSNNTIYPVGTAGATINPYRAYIQIAQDAAPVKALTFFVDGEATAIEGVNADSNVEGEIFNLAGQRVNKAQKGIYVVNGKKVIVK